MRRTFNTLFILFIGGLNLAKAKEFNVDYEPWKTMSSEGTYLDGFVKLIGLTEEEQKELPNNKESLVIKLEMNEAFDESYRDPNSEEYKTLSVSILDHVNNTLSPENHLIAFSTAFSPATSSQLKYKLLSVEHVSDRPLITLLLISNSPIFRSAIENKLKERLEPKMEIGEMSIRNSTIQVYSSVEENTVYEVFIQLYIEPYLTGMDQPDSKTYQNMTDQMMHLIGTRFKNRFGEHFYRMVVDGFFPSIQTLLVRVFVLLDPYEGNLRSAQNIWYSVDGFVHLGKFPLLPDNVRVTDRTYRRPYLNKKKSNAMLWVTLPAALSIFIAILILVGSVRLCHYLTYGVHKDAL